jgi:hypothetical protein
MPFPHERIDEEQIPAQRHSQNLSAIRIFKIDLAISYVITTP